MDYRALALCAGLTGCATTDTVQVKVPVPVKCEVAEPSKPYMPTDSLKVTDSLDTKVKLFQAEIVVRDGYEGELLTALRACKG